MDLPILAGIGEAEDVWIPICFKGLRALSCRQGRGVWHTPYRRPGYGANDFVRYVPNGPFGIVRGAYAVAPYTGDLKNGDFSIHPATAVAVCGAYSIRPYTEGRKPGWFLVRFYSGNQKSNRN